MNMKNKIKITYHVENGPNYPGLTLKNKIMQKLDCRHSNTGAR